MFRYYIMQKNILLNHILRIQRILEILSEQSLIAWPNTKTTGKMTYKSITPAFPRLTISDHNCLFDRSKLFEKTTQAVIRGVIRQSTNKYLRQSSVFLSSTAFHASFRSCSSSQCHTLQSVVVNVQICFGDVVFVVDTTRHWGDYISCTRALGRYSDESVGPFGWSCAVHWRCGLNRAPGITNLLGGQL